MHWISQYINNFVQRIFILLWQFVYSGVHCGGQNRVKKELCQGSGKLAEWSQIVCLEMAKLAKYNYMVTKPLVIQLNLPQFYSVISI